jgi:hypothetical protein
MPYLQIVRVMTVREKRLFPLALEPSGRFIPDVRKKRILPIPESNSTVPIQRARRDVDGEAVYARAVFLRYVFEAPDVRAGRGYDMDVATSVGDDGYGSVQVNLPDVSGHQRV